MKMEPPEHLYAELGGESERAFKQQGLSGDTCASFGPLLFLVIFPNFLSIYTLAFLIGLCSCLFFLFVFAATTHKGMRGGQKERRMLIKAAFKHSGCPCILWVGLKILIKIATLPNSTINKI